MSYLLRLVVPDRPGTLGAVATALGSAGADIASLDVLERGDGFAVDDVVVDLPADHTDRVTVRVDSTRDVRAPGGAPVPAGWAFPRGDGPMQMRKCAGCSTSVRRRLVQLGGRAHVYATWGYGSSWRASTDRSAPSLDDITLKLRRVWVRGNKCVPETISVG